MSIVVVCSAHGAPGVTTSALALARTWPRVLDGRRALLVDADVAGSGLIGGLLGTGLPGGSGVLALAASRRPVGATDVVEAAVGLVANSSSMLLPGVTDPVQARTLIPAWSAIAEVAPELERYGVDVVVDLGRLGHRFEPTPLLRAADVGVVVLTADLSCAIATAAAVRSLRRVGPSTLAALIVGAGYPPAELKTAVDVGAAFQWPRDERSARALLDGVEGGRADRSPLLRAAQALVVDLAELMPDQSMAVSS